MDAIHSLFTSFMHQGTGDIHHPLVTANAYLKASPQQFWTDGKYFDPYYSVGYDKWLTWIGELFQQTPFEEGWIWIFIVPTYPIVMITSYIWYPILMGCLILTSGDVNECSGGVWGNAFKNNNSKCETLTKASKWKNTALTDAEAICYYNRYKTTDLANFRVDEPCDIKIEWDNFGKAAGRNSSC